MTLTLIGLSKHEATRSLFFFGTGVFGAKAIGVVIMAPIDPATSKTLNHLILTWFVVATLVVAARAVWLNLFGERPSLNGS